MTIYDDQDYALYPKTGGGTTFNQVDKVTEDGRQYREVSGYVTTPQGFVRVHSSFYENRYRTSCLEMIKDSRVYYRRFDTDYTARGLVTKAKQFAKELFE